MTESRTLVLFGSTGVLGSALRTALAPQYARILAGDWRTPLETKLEGDADFVMAGGLTDPKLPESALNQSQLGLAKTIAESFLRNSSNRILTFGSVLEGHSVLATQNPYLRAKRELSDWMRDSLSAGQGFHLRLHTLYGIRLKPSMFLGQIAEAIRKKEPFRMTAGEQLREYHHAEDVAASIATLLSRDWEKRTDDLSSGKPVRLHVLASAIFSELAEPSLLRVGELPTPSGENLLAQFPRSPEWLLGSPRDPVRGVIDWLRAELSGSSSSG